MIETVATDRGPKAIGPYSQAVRANGFVFLSGQIPIDPKTQQVVDGDAAAQTERVLENAAACKPTQPGVAVLLKPAPN